MPYVDNGGVRIHYEVEGRGPALVLHHGFTQNLRRWHLAGYVDALRNDYELVLIDARGHGTSDKPHEPTAYALATRVGDVVAVLDDVKRDTAAFWGYSMGGRIGFGLAKYARGRITAFVIGGQHPYEVRLPESSRLVGTDPEAFVAALYQRLNVNPATLPAAIREDLLANDFRALAAAQQDQPSLEDVLPRMTMPCLLYAGDVDPYYSGAQKFAKLIPNARFFSLQGLDHGAAFREAGLVVPHVTEFLQSVTRNAVKS
jgi:pimeloyl-ACP methyl ester carboxylesterase